MGEDIITRTFVRLKERLIVQANSVLLDFSSAEDVVMDAFLKVFDKKYQVDTDDAAEHLLARVVHNESISQIRKQRFSEPLDYVVDIEDAPGEDVDGMVCEMERQMERFLSDTQKYIVRRRDYEGASFERIAKELGMQEVAVRKQLSRARKSLREAIQNEE